ncbi:hypothetical protein [Flavobacterium sp.]|jgi:DNA-directed RNA polymerase beta subunit|uniref:hypothetical protein n=1 Tax=Flavobacterium sp. TaxID=239 RepID=UPI0037BE8BFB
MSRTEAKPEFLSMSSINSMVVNNSSPRAVMDASHFASHLTLLKPDEKLIKSGIEYELGKTIDDVRTEHDCVVKGKVERYAEYGLESPETILFVEYTRNDQLHIDFIRVPSYKSSHGYFGYPLHKTDALQNVGFNDIIPKDTILGQTDSYGVDGSYNYGLNANVAFMSHPSVADDGFVVSESFAKRAMFPSYLKRTIHINKNTIPLNLNGSEDIFKFLPGIGEEVRHDGLLCGLRDRNDWFSIHDLNNQGLMTLDSGFDTSIYVNTMSKVVDIKVVRGNYTKPEFSTRMTEQLDRYAEMLLNFYRSVVNVYEKIMAEKKTMYADSDAVRIAPRLTRFIADCQIKLYAADTGKIKLCYRRLPIDQYRVEITTTSVVKPNYGFKLTDLSASKGVICLILPDKDMPRDQFGNVADVISDGVSSTVSRMNLGRSYEAYIGAYSRDNRQRLIQHLQTQYGPNFLNTMPDEGFEFARQFLKTFHSFINSESAGFVESLTRTEFAKYLREVVERNLFVFYPTDNEKNIVDVVDSINASAMKPNIGKMTYTDGLGRTVQTKDDFRMGVLYMMFLDKIANTHSAVASSKVNNFGFPVKGTNQDKVQTQHSLTPGKILAETECRILISYTNAKAVADMMDLALNPNTHKSLYRQILESPEPFSNRFHIDRTHIPYGETRSLQILKHIFAAAGFVIANTEETK